MNINELKNCCGCSACYNVCPNDAISMIENEEGFKEPFVDKEKCKNCSLCLKVCPIKNPKYENSKTPQTHAYMADDKTREKSSSGGAFFVIAKYFIENNAYVSGAVWKDDYSVEHIVSNKIEDIEKMRGSKYLQSTIGTTYKKIQKLLNANEKVLFTGTPCQIAGLKNFLSKDYKNLFCIDLICHGTPSPKVFKKYIKEEVLTLKDEKWANTNFRDGNLLPIVITTITNRKKYSKEANLDTFMSAFLKNLCLGDSCYDCYFNKIPRQGDITIGDFWAIRYDENLKKKFDDNKGTSLVLINNEKGKILSKILSKNKKIFSKVNKEKAFKGNLNLTSSSVAHKNRAKFFEILDKTTLKENVEKNLLNKCDCMILNFWACVNYGAILTCFGLQCLVEELGYETKVINYLPKAKAKKIFKGSFCEKFANENLNLTKRINSIDDFIALNDDAHTFITGSDQIFNPEILKTHHLNASNWVFLLDFVKSNKRKISYSASFGYENFTGDIYNKMHFSNKLSQFSDISVREDTAQNILKELEIENSEQLIDGAFHIPSEWLNRVTTLETEKYIGCFMLSYFREKVWFKNWLKNLEDEFNLPIKILDFDPKTPVETWLSFIKNSEILVTDSYHGCLFSVIFNVAFLQIENAKTQSRFDSFYRQIEIDYHSINEFNFNETNPKELIKQFDWEKINKNIENNVQKSKLWLKNALLKQPKENKQNDMLNYLEIEIQKQKQETDLAITLLFNNRHIYLKYNLLNAFERFLFGSIKKKCQAKKRKYKKLIKTLENFKKEKKYGLK